MIIIDCFCQEKDFINTREKINTERIGIQPVIYNVSILMSAD